MESRQPLDPLTRLDVRARPRVRVGVGAAVVLLVLSLVAAVLVSAFASPPTAQVVVPSGPASSGLTAAPSSAPSAAPGTIFVHVLGAVRRSGLFEVRAGARVMDVVAAAGGLTEKADQTGINLARLVNDGEQVYVPAVGETRAPPAGASGPGGSPGAGQGAATGGVPTVVNLNTATTAELETLPRIGPAMAQRIIDYRDANGRFAAVDDLRNITGIGDKTLQALAGRVTV